MTSSRTRSADHVRLSAAERREQLVQVAVDLFSRKGFKGTTTREIAAAAGVTEAMIFRHFATKGDLYKAIIDQRVANPAMAAWIAVLQSRIEEDDDEAVVRFLIEAVITTHRVDPKFERLMLYAALEGNEIALLYGQQMTASVVDTFRRYVKRRQQAGKMQAMLPDAALIAIVGMAEHYARCRYIHVQKNLPMSDQEAVSVFTQIAMDGFCLRRTKGAARKKSSAVKVRKTR